MLLLILSGASASAADVSSKVEFRGVVRRSNSLNLSRTRFQFTSKVTQDFGSNFSSEASFRGWIDPAVLSNSRYSYSVRRDEGSSADLRSLFVEYSKLPLKIRVGRQQVVWGEALHYFSADLLHPKDYRDFLTNDLEWARIPQTGVWGSYGWDDSGVKIEFVYFPWTETHRFPGLGSEFSLARYDPLSTAAAIPSEKRFQFSKPTVGANLGFSLGGTDIHLMVVTQRDFQPYYKVSRSEFSFAQIFSTALTASYAGDSWVVRMESSAFFGKRWNGITAGPTVFEYRSPEIRELASFDWNANDDIQLSPSIFYTRRLSDRAGSFLSQEMLQVGLQILLLHLPKQIEFRNNIWVEPKDPSFWISSRLAIPLREQVRLTLISDEFVGKGSTMYSELKGRSQFGFVTEVFF